MINELFNAISTSIYEEFGNDYEIYREEIKQGLKEPCFFISCLKPEVNKFLNNRYFSNIPFCIQYFPVTQDKNIECICVSERLFDCLEYIKDNDSTIMGSNMNYEIVDGVLNFWVNYSFFILKKQNNVVMQEMTQKENVKEE